MESRMHKDKLLLSSGHKDTLQEQLNRFYYSTTYVLNDDGTISWKNGELKEDLYWNFKKNRANVYMKL